MEQTLGHRAHFRNLVQFVAEDPAVAPVWLPIAYEPVGAVARVPGLRGNWSARASWLAARAVHRAAAAEPLDLLFYHTQVTALLAPRRQAPPAVISLDATPINYDTVGRLYGHISGGPLEGVKRAANRRAFAHAAALVTWCDWARASLIADYGIPTDKITTIAPGVDLARWPTSEASRRANLGATDESAADERGARRPRLLFVGGDFARKGGEVLIECFSRHFAERAELWIVTQSPVEPRRGVRVFRDVTPQSDALLRLYADADLFVFPTLADCAPLVVPEAMAAALPVVTTAVGAIPEMVADGRTGLLVAPGSAESLAAAIERLLASRALRRTLGDNARRHVEERYDARRNARQLLDLLKETADRAKTGWEAGR